MGNKGKGVSGHEKPYNGKTNEWYTPKYITDACGSFDLDPCAAINYGPIATTNYTILDDGLKQEWFGRVWMNPPYGEHTKVWLERMSRHKNGIVLIFARTETQMFHNYIWNVASGIFFFEGRIKFINENSGELGPAGAPSCLISYDPDGSRFNHDTLKNCGLKGKFVSLLG